MQQHVEGGKQGHEQRRARFLADALQLFVQCLVNCHGQVIAAIFLHRWARKIGGQFQAGRRTGQLVFPVALLLFQPFARQIVPLPDGKICILDRQRVEGRPFPIQEIFVQHRQLVQQHPA